MRTALATRARPPTRVLLAIGALMMLAASTSTGCRESCDCGPPVDALYVELDEPSAAGGRVEVCFEGACGEGDVPDIGTTPVEVTVPFATLGGWAEERDRAVTVRVDGPNGATILEREVVPDERSSCCGDYWTAHT